jgi:hypothetical protein
LLERLTVQPSEAGARAALILDHPDVGQLVVLLSSKAPALLHLDVIHFPSCCREKLSCFASAMLKGASSEGKGG